ncbi:MAG: hypothetical protein KA715_02725 [Xanthomonadaceae bacterium]|nr:hypothetical protein [Xanthomonadaceae bacterium]
MLILTILSIFIPLAKSDGDMCSKYESSVNKIAKYRSYKEKLIDARDKNKQYLSTLEDHQVTERRKAIENISIAEMKIEAAGNMISANETKVNAGDFSSCINAERAPASAVTKERTENPQPQTTK